MEYLTIQHQSLDVCTPVHLRTVSSHQPALPGRIIWGAEVGWAMAGVESITSGSKVSKLRKVLFEDNIIHELIFFGGD